MRDFMIAVFWGVNLNTVKDGFTWNRTENEENWFWTFIYSFIYLFIYLFIL